MPRKKTFLRVSNFLILIFFLKEQKKRKRNHISSCHLDQKLIIATGKVWMQLTRLLLSRPTTTTTTAVAGS
jgi:hypothetical protein